jgi:hypothetical protein
MIKRGIPLLFLVLIVVCVVYDPAAQGTTGSNAAQEYIRKLSDDSTRVQNEAAEGLYKMGKDAIPHLIDSMGTADLMYIDYTNPFLSTSILGRADLTVLNTEIYAYMVEFILFKDEFVCKDKEKMFLCDYDNHTFIYSYISLFNKKEGRMLLRFKNLDVGKLDVGKLYVMDVSKSDVMELDVDREDIAGVKKMYVKWWERNKRKSLEQLRAEWKNGIKPLSGTDYQWRWHWIRPGPRG